jgi:hypothetical protein
MERDIVKCTETAYMHHFGHSLAASFNQSRVKLAAAEIESSNWFMKISGCFNIAVLILPEL